MCEICTLLPFINNKESKSNFDEACCFQRNYMSHFPPMSQLWVHNHTCLLIHEKVYRFLGLSSV